MKRAKLYRLYIIEQVIHPVIIQPKPNGLVVVKDAIDHDQSTFWNLKEKVVEI